MHIEQWLFQKLNEKLQQEKQLVQEKEMLQQKQQNALQQLVEVDEKQVAEKVALNDAEVVQRDVLAVQEENAQAVPKEEDVVRLPNFSFLHFF